LADPCYSARRRNKTSDDILQYVQRWPKSVRSGLEDLALDRTAAFTQLKLGDEKMKYTKPTLLINIARSRITASCDDGACVNCQCGGIE